MSHISTRINSTVHGIRALGVASLLALAVVAAVAPAGAHAIPPPTGEGCEEPPCYVPPPTPAPAISDVHDAFTTAPTFKSCHGMRTRATLFRELNKVTALTDIWSHCWLGGFTGRVFVGLADAGGRTIAGRDTAYGVNGMGESWFGPNERKGEYWEAYFQANEVQRAKGILVTHTHAMNNRLAEILEEAVRIGRPLVQLIAMIKAAT